MNQEQTVQTTSPVAPAAVAPAPAKREYTGKERALAWISMLVGYLFCRTFFIWDRPVAGLLFTGILFAFAFVFFGKTKRKARSWFYPVSALLLSSALFLAGSGVLHFFTFTYCVAAFLLFCQTGGEEAFETHAAALYLFEFVKAVFYAPFKRFLSSFSAIGAGKGGKKIGKTLLLILAGVAIAIVPTAIVLSLLSFDENFTQLLDRIRETVFDKIGARVWALLFGVPVGMYIFGALDHGKRGAPDRFNAEHCAAIEDKIKFLPSIIGVVALVPLFFLYVIFIVAQWEYYRAVFTGVLPNAYSFSEFARDGFFRLLGVAILNACALSALRVFTKKTQGGKISPVVRVSTVILSLVTIVMAGTAISQMLMYVSAYGLTRLRLYTLWFMALLCLIFFVAILSQFIRPLPFASVCLVLFVAAFGVLTIPDADAFIARHNLDLYRSGTLDKLDVEYLETLGDSAVPVLVELVKEGKDLPANLQAQRALGGLAKNDAFTKGWEACTLPALRAKAAYDTLTDPEKDICAIAYDPVTPGRHETSVRSLTVGNDKYTVIVHRYPEGDRVVEKSVSYVPLEKNKAFFGGTYGSYLRDFTQIEELKLDKELAEKEGLLLCLNEMDESWLARITLYDPEENVVYELERSAR